jgi:pimeloyl-ACP methyl ester carboxylesterase
MVIEATGTARVCASFTPGEPGKPPLVFVHGLAQNDTSGRPLLDFFRARRHPTVSYDLPGHGGSAPYPEGPVDMQRLVGTLIDLLDRCGAQSPVIGVGHSLGGMVILECAVTCPGRIGGLLLIDTADAQPVVANELVDLRPAIQQMIRDSERLFVHQRKVDFAAGGGRTEQEIYTLGLMHTDAAALRQTLTATEGYDVRQRLSSLDVPCLILRGEADTVVSAGMAEGMQSRIAGAALRTVSGGHNWFLQQPQTLQQVLEESYDRWIGVGARRGSVRTGRNDV